MSEPKITEAEWMAELDKMREDVALALTDEQFKIVHYGRSKEQKVPFIEIKKYMQKKSLLSDKINDSVLRHRYYIYCEKHGLERE